MARGRRRSAVSMSLPELLNEVQRGVASAHVRYSKMLWDLATADAVTTCAQLLTAMKHFATVAEVGWLQFGSMLSALLQWGTACARLPALAALRVQIVNVQLPAACTGNLPLPHNPACAAHAVSDAPAQLFWHVCQRRRGEG